MEQITSRTNPLITQIRKLAGSKDFRRETGEMVCEGPKMLEEALHWGARITAVLWDRAYSPTVRLAEKTRQVSVPGDLLRSVALTQTPQKVLFLCRIPSLQPPEHLIGSRYLVLDGMQDPGNVGTIWRTADAFGADGIFLLPGCADPFGPKTVRATMGACFRFPVWETDLETLRKLLHEAGLPLYGTALRADTEDLRQAELSRGAVAVGSEGRGISEQVLCACEKTLKIPMRERCESLNAAAAAAVVLWEMYRR